MRSELTCDLSLLREEDICRFLVRFGPSQIPLNLFIEYTGNGNLYTGFLSNRSIWSIIVCDKTIFNNWGQHFVIGKCIKIDLIITAHYVCIFVNLVTVLKSESCLKLIRLSIPFMRWMLQFDIEINTCDWYRRNVFPYLCTLGILPCWIFFKLVVTRLQKLVKYIIIFNIFWYILWRAQYVGLSWAVENLGQAPRMEIIFLSLESILHVIELAYNLVLISKLTTDHLNSIFHIVFQDFLSGRVIGNAREHEDL